LTDEDLVNLYVGLGGEQAEHLGVGLLCDVDFADRRAEVLMPPDAAARLTEIIFGSIRVSPGGRELGFSRAGMHC